MSNPVINAINENMQKTAKAWEGVSFFKDRDSISGNVIKHGGLTFILNKEIELTVKEHMLTGLNYVYNEYLDIKGFDMTQYSACRMFHSNFCKLYDEHYLADDKNLTDKEKIIKSRLKEIIKTVIVDNTNE